MTKQKPKPKHNPTESDYDSIAEGLRDFGFDHAKWQDVEYAYREWLMGKPPKSLIFEWCYDTFDVYPNIFGPKPTKSATNRKNLN